MSRLNTSGYAPVNGLNMYYEIHGDGEVPLVLIHGGGSTIETSFGNILPFFSANGKVIAMELQAHGRTSDRDAPESFKQDADDVAELLRYLKIPRANFLGFSNGGTTTLQLAIQHPELVNKIVVVSGCYKREGLMDGFFDGMQHATLENMPAPLQTAYLQVNPDEKALHVMFEKDKQRMLSFQDIPDDALRSIKKPALIMAADQDVVTVDHTHQMSRIIPDARMVILPGLHGSFIGELCTAKRDSILPEISARIIEEFIKE